MLSLHLTPYGDQKARAEGYGRLQGRAQAPAQPPGAKATAASRHRERSGRTGSMRGPFRTWPALQGQGQQTALPSVQPTTQPLMLPVDLSSSAGHPDGV